MEKGRTLAHPGPAVGVGAERVTGTAVFINYLIIPKLIQLEQEKKRVLGTAKIPPVGKQLMTLFVSYLRVPVCPVQMLKGDLLVVSDAERH